MNTPEPTPTPAPAPSVRTSSRAVSITAISVGAVVVIGALGVGTLPALASVWSTNPGHAMSAVSADGVERLEVTTAASALLVEYADVSEARLEVRGVAAEGWRIDLDGATLRVESPRGWSPFRWFGETNVTLSLPRALEDADLDAVFDVGAGSVRASGAFDELSLDLGAGEAHLQGSARTLGVDVGAGRATLYVDVADEVDVDVSAGEATGAIGGTGPDRTDVRVSAGSVDLSLPEASYAVTSDVSAGSFDNDLRVDSASPRSVRVTVSAGSLALRS